MLARSWSRMVLSRSEGRPLPLLAVAPNGSIVSGIEEGECQDCRTKSAIKPGGGDGGNESCVRYPVR